MNVKVLTNNVIVYIDGFNLHHGLIDKDGRKYLWLDLEALASSLLKPNQKLISVRYFTANLRNDEAAQQRQLLYLAALAAHTQVEIILGQFQEKNGTCYRCGPRWRTYEEKETDVSIAVSLLEDGVLNRFDTALLISADSDLCPSIRALKRLNQNARVIAVFPPHRHSEALRRAVFTSFTLSDAKIRKSLLPEVVNALNGSSYKRPGHWR